MGKLTHQEKIVTRNEILEADLDGSIKCHFGYWNYAPLDSSSEFLCKTLLKDVTVDDNSNISVFGDFGV